MVGMLDKVKKEIVTGQVEVKQTFKISKVGTIAGGLVKFCAKIGMNYASCSPFRVPIARLAAAQAAVEEA